MRNYFKFGSAYSLPFCPTDFAHSCTVSLDVGIEAIVRMPLRAVRFLALCFSKLQAQLTPSAVFLMGDCLKVGRIHASVVATKVVNLFPDWNRCNKQFVGKSMGTHILPAPLVYTKYSIARFISACRPIPTTIFPVLINFIPKPIFSWARFCSWLTSHITIIPRITTLINSERAGFGAFESIIEKGGDDAKTEC